MNTPQHPISLAQKLEIETRTLVGEIDRHIAEAMHLSLWVVRKWRRKVQTVGRTGLSVPRGRPKRGALSTYPTLLREQLLHWRQAHPGWGPTTLLARLGQDLYWQDQPLPDRSQIGRFLHEAGLTRCYQRHSQLPQCAQGRPQAPHEEWEVDAQAAQHVPGIGWVILLDIVDVYSTMKIACQAVIVSGRHSKAKADDHQLALRWGFLRAGLPDRLAVDHDSAYYDRSPAPFPTRLHLWLIALGIGLAFGRFGRATDQATVERMHPAMTRQSVCGQTFSNLWALQSRLDQDLDFVNYHLPSRSLGNRPPLVAYPEATQPRRWYRPEGEEHLLDMERVYEYLAQGRWFRLVGDNGWISLGDYRYKVGRSWAKQQVEIIFDRTKRQFVVKAEDGTEVQHLTPKGLTPKELMGEAAPFYTLPTMQLALPFTPTDWRQLQLAVMRSGMDLCDFPGTI